MLLVPYHGTTLVISALALMMSSGCCSQPKQPAPVWIPRPLVGWSQLSSAPVPAVRDEYRILVEQPTVGLFPANMSVTRVAISQEEAPSEPTLFADPRNEFLQWNRAFDDQMAISEVFPIDQRDLGGGMAEPDQILAAFRALHARLGLIYAVNELGPCESEMFGVLYDTFASRPLVVVHAHAQSVAPLDENEKAKPDPWETDSRALVRVRFEKLTYAALHKLIVSDQPARSDPPAGWVPAGPIRPVEWPPRHRVPRP